MRKLTHQDINRAASFVKEKLDATAHKTDGATRIDDSRIKGEGQKALKELASYATSFAHGNDSYHRIHGHGMGGTPIAVKQASRNAAHEAVNHLATSFKRVADHNFWDVVEPNAHDLKFSLGEPGEAFMKIIDLTRK